MIISQLKWTFIHNSIRIRKPDWNELYLALYSWQKAIIIHIGDVYRLMIKIIIDSLLILINCE